MKLNEALSLRRYDLLRAIYNGLANDPENKGMGHSETLKEAHYMCSILIEGEPEPMETGVSIGDKAYNTFEFGEINPMNCTPEKLLYLVKTYPEVWIKRLV